MHNEEDFLKELNAEMQKIMEEHNAMPMEEMDNLSPNDMQFILYDPFGEESPIGFKKDISNEVLDQIPFFKLVEAYFEMIEEAKELKLTAKGNLQRKVVKELYEKGFIKEDHIETGITKLSKEQDSLTIQNTKIIAELAGLTKKRYNKVSLTKKGIKLRKPENRAELFKTIFLTNCQKFNLGYHDGYAQQVGVQRTFGFTLYLLLQYGKEQNNMKFYTDKYILAFPFDLEFFESSSYRNAEDQLGNCLSVRVFERFLDFYGLIDFQRAGILVTLDEIKVQTNDLFDQVFELRPSKFKFRKSKHQA